MLGQKHFQNFAYLASWLVSFNCESSGVNCRFCKPSQIPGKMQHRKEIVSIFQDVVQFRTIIQFLISIKTRFPNNPSVWGHGQTCTEMQQESEYSSHGSIIQRTFKYLCSSAKNRNREIVQGQRGNHVWEIVLCLTSCISLKNQSMLPNWLQMKHVPLSFQMFSI